MSENQSERYARVVRKFRDRYEIEIDGEIQSCVASGALAAEGAESPAVGDFVEFTPGSGAPPLGRITAVRPRRNRLSRRAAGTRPVEQVIAANLDLLVVVAAAAEPPLRPGLIDRYLVQAEADEIPVLLCVTKGDLVAREQIDLLLRGHQAAGYELIVTSTRTGAGLEALSARLAGRLCAFVGKSGVGKTTLLQGLLERAGRADPSLRTAGVSRSTGKGKHTTTEARLIPLTEGGAIVDTPGVREFALWDIPAERVAFCFPEMRPFLDACRFGSGCTHAHEPDCAVKRAVREGAIDPDRYRSYLRITGYEATGGTDGIGPAGKDGPGSGSGAKSPAQSRYGPGSGSAGSRGAHTAGSSPPKHSAGNERRHGPVERDFTCGHCGTQVGSTAPGTAHRNHCPHCLWSRHLDRVPGDRAAACGALMDPIAVTVRPDGEWMLLHRCSDCGAIRVNRIAGDDNEWLLLSLAARPLARPPFPIDRMTRGAEGR